MTGDRKCFRDIRPFISLMYGGGNFYLSNIFGGQATNLRESAAKHRE